MKEKLKNFIRFRIDFRQAVLIAFLLHLLLFLFVDEEGILVPVTLTENPQTVNKMPDEMDFKFVEVPDDISEPNPDARSFSDKDRRASTPNPQPNPNAPQEPQNEGETPEAMLSKSQVVKPVPPEKMEQPRKETEEKIIDKSDETTDKRTRWEQRESADKVKAEELLRDYAKSNSKQNLSKRNLSKYFEFQDYNSPSSSIVRDGGIQFDTKGFDFGRWLKDFYYKVYSNWTIPLAFEALRQSGQLTLRFDVHRDGSVSGLDLLNSSGLVPYDEAALTAILRSNPFLPLPEGYPDDKMEVKCRFIYRWSPAPSYQRSNTRRRR